MMCSLFAKRTLTSKVLITVPGEWRNCERTDIKEEFYLPPPPIPLKMFVQFAELEVDTNALKPLICYRYVASEAV